MTLDHTHARKPAFDASASLVSPQNEASTLLDDAAADGGCCGEELMRRGCDCPRAVTRRGPGRTPTFSQVGMFLFRFYLPLALQRRRYAWAATTTGGWATSKIRRTQRRRQTMPLAYGRRRHLRVTATAERRARWNYEDNDGDESELWWWRMAGLPHIHVPTPRTTVAKDDAKCPGRLW